MKCQNICLENQPFTGWIEEGIRFTEKETAILLEPHTHDELPRDLIHKLEEMYLLEYENVLARNLRALLPKL
jgi:hypothetical protein